MHSVLRFSYVWATIALNQWSPFTNPDAHASLDRRVPRARQRLAFLILARSLRLVLTLSFMGYSTSILAARRKTESPFGVRHSYHSLPLFKHKV
jgi:hypothetical protein